MSGISGRIHGTAKLLARLGEVENLIVPIARQEIEVAAFAVQRDARKLISSTKGSKRETRYNPKREVTVSPPGAPPNTDRGKLVASIGVEVDEARITATVGTNLKYGRYLELGTKNISARPWLFPAIEGRRAEFQRNLREAIRRGLKQVNRG